MKSMFSYLLLLASLLLAGCTTMLGARPAPGASEQEVVARMGAPAHRYKVEDHTLLEYPGGYYGQQTWVARLGQDGRLIAVEQVRTVERFSQIKVNESTKQDVLRLVGTPSETTWLGLVRREVWSYRYKESEVWNSIMYIQFDQAGVVRQLENGRDPLYDNSERSSGR